MKVYLSGAITGNARWREEFEEAQHRVARAGFAVINPATIGDRLEKALGHPPKYSEYMWADLVQLLGCDFIFFVNDWSISHGADVEARVAKACGIKELTQKDLEEAETRVREKLQQQEEAE